MKEQAWQNWMDEVDGDRERELVEDFFTYEKNRDKFYEYAVKLFPEQVEVYLKTEDTQFFFIDWMMQDYYECVERVALVEMNKEWMRFLVDKFHEESEGVDEDYEVWKEIRG